MPRFGCIVPVAGLSSRMNDFKPLLMIKDDETMIASTVGRILKAGIDPCVVILGHRGSEVRAHLEDIYPGKLIFLTNGQYAASDMFSSLKLGATHLLEEQQSVDGVFILPGDMPCISLDTFYTLMAAFDKKRCDVTLPTYFGKTKHPPLLAKELLDELLTFQEDTGLRGFLASHEKETCYVATEDEGCLYDADTPAEFNHAKRYMNR